MSRLRLLFVAFGLSALLLGGIGVADAAAPSDPEAKENPNTPGPKPGCSPSDQTPKKCPTDPEPEPEGPEAGNCDDGEDNDLDGLVDGADPDCQEGPTEGNCADGEDNDDDGTTDSEDSDCTAEGCVVDEVNTCNEVTPRPTTETSCDDGIDNDGDGLVDDEDGDCATEGNCTDGEDNDDDGTTDSEDSDCTAEGCMVEDVNTCREVTPPPPAETDPCTEANGDAGLLGDTIGQMAFDAGLGAIPVLIEDPAANGVLSGAIIGAGDETPAEPLTNEVGCAVDLLLSEADLPGDL